MGALLYSVQYPTKTGKQSKIRICKRQVLWIRAVTLLTVRIQVVFYSEAHHSEFEDLDQHPNYPDSQL